MNKFFRIPFADNGDRAAVNDDSLPSGIVTYEQGYGPDYELANTEPNYRDIPRDQDNQLKFDLTTAVQEYQIFGTPDFITTAQNGGAPYSYAKDARVVYLGEIYQSFADANTTLPTDNTKWRWIDNGIGRLIHAPAVFDVAVSDFDVVYWTGTDFTRATAANPGITTRVVGIADVTNNRVFRSGLLGGFVGLVPGDAYYLSSVTLGAITNVVGAGIQVLVGYAKSATELFIQPGEPGVEATDGAIVRATPLAAGQLIPNVGATKIILDVASVDVGGYYDTVLSRWTPAAGLYDIIANLIYVHPATVGFVLQLEIRVNGGVFALSEAVHTGEPLPLNQTIAVSSGPVALNGTDFVELFLVQSNAGGSIPIARPGIGTYLGGHRIG